jgi:hypothetical protein
MPTRPCPGPGLRPRLRSHGCPWRYAGVGDPDPHFAGVGGHGDRVRGNCVGAIVPNTGWNIAGDWTFTGNRISENNAFCPGNEEEGTPPLSGIGIASPAAPTTR